jgi:hypothetical protein
MKKKTLRGLNELYGQRARAATVVSRRGKLHPDAQALKATAPPPIKPLERDADGAKRVGRVFTLRLRESDERALREARAMHERQTSFSSWNAYGFATRPSLGAFIIWAARQFKPAVRR